MNLEKILNKLEKYTDIPRLSFQLESEEYVYMADTMSKMNFLLKNLSLIESNKKNLKIYRDDPETIRNIKDVIGFYEKSIENSLESLEKNYIEHNKKLNSLVNYNEDYEEKEM